MKSTKSLTFGSMMVGMMSLILLLDRMFLGNLGFMLFLPVTVPIIVYGFLFSFKETVVVAVSMVIMSVIASGIPAAIVSVLGYSCVALSAVFCQKRKWQVQFAVMFVVDAIVTFVMVVFFAEYFGVNIQEQMALVVSWLGPVSSQVMWSLIGASLLLTVLMEVYIIQAFSKIIIMRWAVKIQQQEKL